jgi:Cytochrome oxidase complex assembly protein 1
MKIKVDDRLRTSDYYLKAVAHVKAHRPLVNYLGEPLKFGKADLSDISRNHTVGDTEAVFEIPIKGSVQSGKMHFTAVRTTDNVPTLNSNANNSEEPPSPFLESCSSRSFY